MATNSNATAIVLEYCVVHPPEYQMLVGLELLDDEARDKLGATLLWLLQTSPPGSGLQFPTATVMTLSGVLRYSQAELATYRVAALWHPLTHLFHQFVKFREAHQLAAQYIISVLVAKSPEFSQHLANEGKVECHVLTDRLELFFPNFNFPKA